MANACFCISRIRDDCQFNSNYNKIIACGILCIAMGSCLILVLEEFKSAFDRSAKEMYLFAYIIGGLLIFVGVQLWVCLVFL